MIAYRLDIADAHAHRIHVTLTVPAPAPRQRLALPVWIPGSYLVREFGRHLAGVAAQQDGRSVPVTQIDKTTWEASTDAQAPLVVTYQAYAFDTSVRTAYLDAQRGFFNGTSVALRVEGREGETHRLELAALPRGWQVATAMRAAASARHDEPAYEADGYDELVDHPFELGRFWRGEFTAHGVPHEFVVAGALPDFDGERLLADVQRVCETAIAFWDPERRAPFDRYVFMLNAVDDGYGGLEHRASTALICARRDLPQRGKAEASDAYTTLLGLVSHEYFHAWNVKRLKPREFARYDYTRENYTELLWFFEGFTSYYDDLLLRRAGLVDDARYLKLVAKSITGVLGMPGRKVQSLAQASFDAWVKYYRTDENTPNATISYYTKGALVALALDLTLRSLPGAEASLDAVMRLLWKRSGGGPIGEEDVRAALREVAGRPLDEELDAFVHGTGELPLQPLLERFAVEWQAQPATLAQRLGLRVSETPLTGIKVTHVLRGGAAEQAGFAAGDELLAIGEWRLRRLEDALRTIVPGEPARVLAARDQRLLPLVLTLPPDDAVAGAVALAPDAKASRAAQALRKAWLAGG